MANIPNVKVLPSPFAENASSSYKNEIPAKRTASIPNNAATYDDGFGSATFLPIDPDNPENSGIPPRGGDFNGILGDLSVPLFRAQMGLPINTWTSEIAALGYPAGAIVWYNGSLYRALSANSQIPTNSNFWQNILFLPSSFPRFPNWGNVQTPIYKTNWKTDNPITLSSDCWVDIYSDRNGAWNMTIQPPSGNSYVYEMNLGEDDFSHFYYPLQSGTVLTPSVNVGYVTIRLIGMLSI